MPTYEFECNKCSEKFEIGMSVSDREKKAIVCPKCGSDDIGQVFSRMSFIIKEAEKSCPGNNGGSCDACCYRNNR